jgi:hypothetical protein
VTSQRFSTWGTRAVHKGFANVEFFAFLHFFLLGHGYRRSGVPNLFVSASLLTSNVSPPPLVQMYPSQHYLETSRVPQVGNPCRRCTVVGNPVGWVLGILARFIFGGTRRLSENLGDPFFVFYFIFMTNILTSPPVCIYGEYQKVENHRHRLFKKSIKNT